MKSCFDQSAHYAILAFFRNFLLALNCVFVQEQLAAITQEKASLEETIENLTAEKVGLMKKIAAIEAELKRTQENQSSNEAKNLVL